MSDFEKTTSRKRSLRLPIFIFVLLLFTAHSFFMGGHKYVNKYLNVGTYIDPIAAEANPDLFKNSFYVQAVQRTNVRLNLIYDLYPWVYKHFDFEAFALAQEIASLFFMLAAVFALARAMFGGVAAGCVAMLLYTAALESWTLGCPAPYLDFFHHGLHYGYPFMAWSLVFFIYKRFPLSLFLAGCAWNFHPMCTAFLLFTYSVYWVFNRREFPLKTILFSVLAFTIPALPVLIQAFDYAGKTGEVHELWSKGVYWNAWYSCLPSTWPAKWVVRAGLFFAVFFVALVQVPKSEKRRTVGIVVFAVGLLCAIGTIFADLYPVPFIMRLSLWRSTLFYLLLALPCIAYFLLQLWEQRPTCRLFVIVTVAVITGYVPGLNFYYLPAVILFLVLAAYEEPITRMLPWLQGRLPLLAGAALIATLVVQGARGHIVVPPALFLIAALLFAFVSRLPLSFFAATSSVKGWLLPALFVLFVDVCVLWGTGGPPVYYKGTIKGEVDPWADMQIAAAKHSDKDDLFIVPPYMNDFGLYSQRATIGDWAEGANILYLDALFTQQWFERMYDLGWRTQFGAKTGYNALTTDEMRNTARKYNASFVITEKPKELSLPKVYENAQYVLYSLK